MRRFARCAAVYFLCLLAFCAIASAARPHTDSLYHDLPRDPLLVLGVALNAPSSEVGSMALILDRLRQTSDNVATQGLMADPELLTALRRDLLPHLGPEMALVVDLPPIDQLLGTLQLSPEETVGQILTDAGVVADVGDAAAVETFLRRWSSHPAAAQSGEGRHSGRLSFAFETEAGAAGTRLELFYRIGNGRLALGFSPSWVESAVKRRARGERLSDGPDFKRVFTNLDQRPSDLTYVNLPKLRSHIAGSQLMRLAMNSNSDLDEFFQLVMTEQAMAVGIGSSSVAVDGGVRTTQFGPSWMSGTAVSSGFLAALALPNLMTAVERGRAERTSTDVLAIAHACEGFSTDSRRYPGPTKGWVPVEQIASYLEPIYIGVLPTTDGWRNPIMYWSDGGSFRVMSTGRDGAMDRDWSVAPHRRRPTDLDGDIVVSEEGPVAWPVASDAR